MPSQQPKKHAEAWRSRREEYLRVSGRQSDLVKEGFEQAPSTTTWAVIVGGRASRPGKPNPRGALFLIKRVGS
jgi:phosphoglycolate phosphatase-like HAD superfamily hydrolase